MSSLQLAWLTCRQASGGFKFLLLTFQYLVGLGIFYFGYQHELVAQNAMSQMELKATARNILM
jgi:hypothetical protein